MAKKRKLERTQPSIAPEEMSSVHDVSVKEEPASSSPIKPPIEASSLQEFGDLIKEEPLPEEHHVTQALENTENVENIEDTSGAGEGFTVGDEEDGDSDPASVQQLLDPFSKEQLVGILRDAALNHPDVLAQIRQTADLDPAHRKIFVHGLGWNATADTLIEAFQQFGEIEDCKAVVDKISGRSKGYGFILFKHRSGAHRALKEPQKKIGTKMTACQLASAGPPSIPSLVPATLPTLPAIPMSELTQRKIYVSNVGPDMDPNKVLQFFSKFGEIEEGPLGLDKTSGKPRGFCLFVYKNVESAKKALEEPHKNFEGHILHCQKAIDGPKPNKPGIQLLPAGAQYGALHQVHSGFVAQMPQFGRIEGAVPLGAPSSSISGPGHLIAPPAVSIRYNHAGQPTATTAAAFNPVLGVGMKNGGLAANPAFRNQVGVAGGYIKPGVVGNYAASLRVHGSHVNAAMGQGSTWTQQGLGHMGSYGTSTGQ